MHRQHRVPCSQYSCSMQRERQDMKPCKGLQQSLENFKEIMSYIEDMEQREGKQRHFQALKLLLGAKENW